MCAPATQQLQPGVENLGLPAAREHWVPPRGQQRGLPLVLSHELMAQLSGDAAGLRRDLEAHLAEEVGRGIPYPAAGRGAFGPQAQRSRKC